MSDFLYRKIIGEASKLSPPLHTLFFPIAGEPLLDPDIVERLNIARSELHSSTFINLFTNGSFLNDEFISGVAQIPNFTLVVSINGASRETRKRLMGLDDYDHVVKYTRKAIEAGIKCIPSLVKYDISEQELKEFDKIWWGNSRNELNLLNFAGSVFNSGLHKGICNRAIFYMAILWDGRVNLCCMDVLGKVIFGDLNESTIEEVWNSKERQRYILFHLIGKSVLLKGCSECNHPRR